MSSQAADYVPLWRVSARVGRLASVVLALVVAAILLANVTAKSALGATAIFIGGIGEPTLDQTIMRYALGQKYRDHKRVSFAWPAEASPIWGKKTLQESVSQGTRDLYIMLTDPSLPAGTVVIGSSAGALVVDETLRLLDNSGVDKSKVSFVVIADGSRQDSFDGSSPFFRSLSGYTYQAPPETKYDVDVVTYEYDGFADFPDRWWNLAAVANSLAGIVVLHNATYFQPLDGLTPKRTQNSKGGWTNRYLIPAKTLPLVALNPYLAPIQPQLKQLIDSGYSRNDRRALAISAAQVNAAALQDSTSALEQQNNSRFLDASQTVDDPTDETTNNANQTVDDPTDETTNNANQTVDDPTDDTTNNTADAGQTVDDPTD